MEYRGQSNGRKTFLEHWWFVLVPVVDVLAMQVFTFFTRLCGTPWIWCYSIGLAVAAVGASLIFLANCHFIGSDAS
jgi:hypothetical protein